MHCADSAEFAPNSTDFPHSFASHPAGGGGRSGRRFGPVGRVKVAVDDEHADRNDRAPESPDHGRGDPRELLAGDRYGKSSRGVATLGSRGLQASSRTYVSPTGAKSVCSADTLTCRSVGPTARCRWPWTLTAPAGTFSSGMCVNTSGGSVAHKRRPAGLVEANSTQRRDVAVVVAQDQKPLAQAFGQVAQQAIVAPGIRMGDVAEADDGVLGADAASPIPEQVPVHLLDAPERPTPTQRYRGVRQM